MAAVAVLGAFAGSAIAADVTLYGVLDMGLAYNLWIWISPASRTRIPFQ